MSTPDISAVAIAQTMREVCWTAWTSGPVLPCCKCAWRPSPTGSRYVFWFGADWASTVALEVFRNMNRHARTGLGRRITHHRPTTT